MTSIKDIPEGTVISFETKRADDVNLYQGVLESIGTYRSIRSIIDPSAYNEAVRQSDPSVPSDITLLTYFQITLDNASTDPQIMVFADQWIKPGTLLTLSLGNKVTLQVDDPFNNSNQIISILASAGYSSKIIS